MATVLIIDDHAHSRTAAGRLLRLEGHEVIYAENAWQGLAALETEAVDLVLLDLDLPGMSGQEFLSDIANDLRWRDLPVIIFSGRDVSPALWQAHKEHVRDWLTKATISGEQLMDSVKTHAGWQRQASVC